MADAIDEALAAAQAEPQTDTGAADQLAAMKAEIEAERQAKEQASAAAAAAAKELEAANQARQKAVQDKFGAQDAAIANALTSATNDVATWKATITRYQTEGNFEAATDAIDNLTEAKIRVKQAEGQKRWLDEQKGKAQAELAAEEERRKTAAQQQQADPLAHLSSAARQWVSAHPRFLNDAAYRDKAIAAANYAEKVHGYAADSPEYYEHIETALGERQQVDDGSYQPEPRPQPRQQQQRTSMAAQPSRSTAPSANGRPGQRTFNLSREQKEMALAIMPSVAPDGKPYTEAQIYAKYAENLERGMREKPLLGVGT